MLCPQDGTPLSWSEGTVIRGKYRILDRIGQGGMAVVYKALHVRFEEVRALKVINPNLASDPVFGRRFIQEAVLTRKLKHPNAAQVEDIDEAEDGRPFIVMEYIQGSSLKDVIQECGPLSASRTCPIIKQVAAALGEAHKLGIIHRDIKPSNIVLIKTHGSEQAKVLDFGIAKLKENRAASSAAMTLTGTVVGTPIYMSPEQAMGKGGDELDGRSDLYSLGVVMYQMLTGDLPLKADSEMQMMLAHINTPPKPIADARPDLHISGGIAKVVMRCLEKKPEMRPANALALMGELDRAMAQEKAEEERLARERAKAERRAAELAEAERIAREKAERKRLDREKAERDLEARQRAEAEGRAAKQAAAERAAREKAERERLAGHTDKPSPLVREREIQDTRGRTSSRWALGIVVVAIVLALVVVGSVWYQVRQKTAKQISDAIRQGSTYRDQGEYGKAAQEFQGSLDLVRSNKVLLLNLEQTNKMLLARIEQVQRARMAEENHNTGRESRGRLSKEEVIDLLENDVIPRRVAALAHQFGITFEPTAETESQLRGAGGTQDLLDTLRLLPHPPHPPKVEEPVRAGPLLIQSTPGGAQVYVDDVFVGTTNTKGRLEQTNLMPGEHKVSLMLKGYLSNVRKVKLMAGEPGSITATLEPEVKVEQKIAEAIRRGDIDRDQGKYDEAIREFRDGLNLERRNKDLLSRVELTRSAQTFEESHSTQKSRGPLSKDEVMGLLRSGVTPPRTIALARRFTILLELSPQVEAQLRDAGATREVLDTLRQLAPPRLKPLELAGPLLIQSTPGGAQVSVDGRPQGMISAGRPMEVTGLSPGKHKVRVELKGYKDYEQTLDLVGGQSLEIAVKLDAVKPPEQPPPVRESASVNFRVSHQHSYLTSCQGQLTIGNGRVKFQADNGKHTFDAPLNGIEWAPAVGGGLFFKLEDGKRWFFHSSSTAAVLQVLQKASGKK